jgi:DNA-binding transcriptional regulator PaaX
MKKEKNRTDIRKIILNIVAGAGLVSVAILAPNILRVLSKVQKQKTKYKQRYYVNVAVKQLIEKKFIEYHKNGQGFSCLRLTEKGREELKKYALQDLVIKKPLHWDGKYRVITFDIKEFKRKTRNQLRNWLEHLGFVKLQNSVWVFPYECREVIILLKSHFKIGKEVLYMTVDSIENDRWLKEEFGLEKYPFIN